MKCVLGYGPDYDPWARINHPSHTSFAPVAKSIVMSNINFLRIIIERK